MQLPTEVKIVEVGPRDGLQNEKKIVPTEIKIALIKKLADTGLRNIEATSFVSPKWVPQLADHTEVMQQLPITEVVKYPVLVPNLQGFAAAIAAGARDISLFTTPSEQFSMKNTHCTVAESIHRLSEVIAAAKQKKLFIRAYISCVIVCPYEGKMPIQKVAALAKQLIDLGCNEISLGDTIGAGTPLEVTKLIQAVSKYVPISQLAVHFHDTYACALANIYASLQCGVNIVDASIAGLGGCPYAKGASGNVASEDVVYMLNGLGIKTGIDLSKLIAAGQFISAFLERKSASKVSLAMSSNE